MLVYSRKIFDMYDHLSVLSWLKVETYLWRPSVPTLLHIYRLKKKTTNITVSGLFCISVSHLQPIQIIPVVIIRGHEDVLLCWGSKWWMRIYRVTLGVLLRPLPRRFCFCLCYFIVILDHIQWGINFNGRWDECDVCRDGTDLDKICIWAGNMHHDTWIDFFFFAWCSS